VLKRHLPYHESDHVLNMAYNIMAGGERLEDIELRRQDECFLNGLGAQRIPDPTTAGDFHAPLQSGEYRQFNGRDQRGPAASMAGTTRRVFGKAVIDVDGTIAATLGECKAGWTSLIRGSGLCAVDRESGQH